MDIRRVQMTGGSSFIVTLPKEWAESIGLKKNDPLRLSPQQDGSIIITSADTDTHSTYVTKMIDVNGLTDPDLIFRMLVGAYMSGFSLIEVVSSARLSNTVLDVVGRMTQMAIGLEIIEEYDSKVVLKDLVDPSEMKMGKSLERMRVLVRNMMADASSALKNDMMSLVDDIIARDSDVDRLAWLITRQTNMFQRDVGLLKKIGMDHSEITMNYTISRFVERIGDHTVAISDNSRHLIGNPEFKDTRAEASRLCDLVVAMFIKSLGTVGSNDPKVASDCVNESRELGEAAKSLNKYGVGKDYDVALAINLITGSLRRICEYSMDISELAINAIMGRDDKKTKK
ncbi:MAG: AbrB/MazE/SpoVT family DNA-binding domain-containing protein [Methanomassiliicoccaceae archaeon]|jgi:phosphate uptake regulator|nr:AbrB/MazE/SpoVT family DNA-binding domain-containing protein [Methanomassiliicoccaceae archaeon]